MGPTPSIFFMYTQRFQLLFNMESHILWEILLMHFHIYRKLQTKQNPYLYPSLIINLFREFIFNQCLKIIFIYISLNYQKVRPITWSQFQFLRRALAFGRGFFCPSGQKGLIMLFQPNQGYFWCSVVTSVTLSRGKIYVHNNL